MGMTRCNNIIKHTDDGSHEVNGVIRELTKSRNFRICGVNTDQCVYFTTRGLKILRYRVEVWSPGTNGESVPDHVAGIYLLSKVAKVRGKLLDKRLKAA